MIVITDAKTGLLPTVFAVEGDGGGIGFGDLEKNGAVRLSGDGLKEGGSHAAAPEGGVNREVEDFGFIRGGLTPRAKTRGGFCDEGQQERIAGIVAERPLGGFGTVVLDAGNGGVVALDGGADGDGL